jgi:hypothetical protein
MRCGVKFSSALLYAYPVAGKASFCPSGDPSKDDAEPQRMSQDDYLRSCLPQSKKIVQRSDAERLTNDPTGLQRRILAASSYWESIRWKKDRRTPAERERDRRLRRQKENGII